jgi:hypothetical protein
MFFMLAERRLFLCLIGFDGPGADVFAMDSTIPDNIFVHSKYLYMLIYECGLILRLLHDQTYFFVSHKYCYVVNFWRHR